MEVSKFSVLKMIESKIVGKFLLFSPFPQA